MKDVKIYATTIDGKAINQIYELADQKAFENEKIRIMPDAHPGAGCVIGFTSTYSDKIIPNVVGVDLFCGMLCINLGKVELDLEKIDNFIKSSIPLGHNINEKAYSNSEMFLLNKQIENMNCYKQLQNIGDILKGCGSLGGGNHFIEIDEDDEGNKYLVIHSGSRNFGKQVATIYQDIAIHECRDVIYTKDEINSYVKSLKEAGKQKEINDLLKKYKESKAAKEPNLNKDLCYLEGQSLINYLEDIKVCRTYANMSRRYMAQRIIEYIFSNYGEISNGCAYIEEDFSDAGYEDKVVDIRLDSFETLHNYIDVDTNIIRKGAIRALKDEIVLIPINMRDGSLICKGRGNDDWNNSAPHGAGRILSRGEAKEQVSLEDFKKSMEGIYTSSVNESTLDESPFVYKSKDEIMQNIQGSVEILKVIKPIYNCKAGE